ncbi:hypothetical protein [Nocardioides sp. R-C-SC26]|uniref:hypothetical protein n=1 Tax=Nocardioides sp. R-C-SC26 TaxID=2870414 RepID=UPI001E334A61|nr:hypothetical protein [Nocardioides sp. R-C-SC26]
MSTTHAGLGAAAEAVPPDEHTRNGSAPRRPATPADTRGYDELTRLVGLIDQIAEELRERAGLGHDVVSDPAFADSAALSTATHLVAEHEIRAATTGKHGLLARSIELDADALALRATVATYRWLDDLRDLAERTLGSIAGRAIGYLAPEVELGGALVAAGLIETDPTERDDVTGYLAELASANPELMEHVTTGGGGLVDALPLRALLTAGVPGGAIGLRAARGGMNAVGAPPFEASFGDALRDAAGRLVAEPDAGPADVVASPADPMHEEMQGQPLTWTALLDAVGDLGQSAIVVRRVGVGRYVALIGAQTPTAFADGDTETLALGLDRHIRAAVDGDTDARLLVMGHGLGGVAATHLAAGATSGYRIEQVITTAAPTAQSTAVPDAVRVLAIDDPDDPVAVLGSLVNASVEHRVSVLTDDPRELDATDHPAVRGEFDRLRDQGYLA